jgi:ABC-type multidrug transport system fused ATPase/permease subunit
MNFTQKYIATLTKLLNYKTRLYNVDFDQSWIKLLLKKRLSLFFAVVNEVIGGAYNNYLPIAFAGILRHRNYGLLPWIVAGYIILEILNRFAVQYFLNTKLLLEQSIRNSAYRFFLTTDPIHHSTKSSGKIISLIETGCSDIYQAVNIAVSFILPDAVAYLTIAIVLFQYDLTLGLFSLGFFCLTVFINYSYSIYHRHNLHPLISEQIENSRAIATENLSQNAVIRASFATMEQIQYSNYNFAKEVDLKSTLWFSSQLKNTFLRSLFIFAAFVVISRIFGLLDTQAIPLESAIAIIGVYLTSSYRSLGIGDNIAMLNEKISSVDRMYKFIREFGQPSYAVIDKRVITKEN